jgi:ABC-type multidrug transport system fused ATPase/permease subunit
MIKFLLKLWRLNRRYKGRFFLGACFGALNGAGQPLVYGTAFFVASVLFAANSPEELKRLGFKVPAWLPEGVRLVFHQFKDWVTAQAAGSLGARLAVVSLIPLVVLLRSIVAYLSAYLMSWVAIRTITDLRARLFEHLLHLPLSFFTGTSTGELMSRSIDINILQNIMASSLATMVQAPFSILTCLVMMLSADWRLTILASFVFPLCVIPISIYSRKGRRASAALQTEQANLGKLMHESFTGNRIIKAYNLEGVVVHQFQENLKRFVSNFMRVIRATETPGPLIEFVGAIGIACIFLHFAANASVGASGVFLLGLLLIYPPIKNLTRLQSQITQAQAATGRIFDLLATPNTLTDPANPVPLRAAGAEIHFDNVSFGYGDKLVLRQIQLTVQPGRMIALVGQSGSGKTTLTNLLLRFYDPTEGGRISTLPPRDLLVPSPRPAGRGLGRGVRSVKRGQCQDAPGKPTAFISTPRTRWKFTIPNCSAASASINPAPFPPSSGTRGWKSPSKCPISAMTNTNK